MPPDTAGPAGQDRITEPLKVLCDPRWSLAVEYAVNLERLMPSVPATKIVNRVTFHDAVKTLCEVRDHRREVEHYA